MKLLIVFLLLCFVSCFGFGFSVRIPSIFRFWQPKHIEEKRFVFNCEYMIGQDFVDSYQDAFRTMDHDGDGEVTPEDVMHHFGNMEHGIGPKKEKLSREEAEDMVSEGDTNNDGKLSEKEWIEMFVKMEIEKLGADIKDSFDIFDNDGDKKISEAELEEVFKQLKLKDPQGTARWIIDAFDCDGDGQLNMEEFIGFSATQNKDSE